MAEISKIQVLIRRLEYETREAVKDPVKAQQWLISFVDTLKYQDLCNNPMPYAMELIEEAMNYSDMQKEKAQARWTKAALENEGVRNPTKEQLEKKRSELYKKPKATRYPTKEQACEYVQDECGIPYDLGGTWWEMHKERGFRFRDGSPIKFWKIACKRWCENELRKQMEQRE